MTAEDDKLAADRTPDDGETAQDNGWHASAAAWIADMGEAGDWGRRAVLDRAMLARVRRRPWRAALDVGCGEGRFCRLLAAEGIRAVGIDPVPAMLDAAWAKDPAGDYRLGRAEALAVPDAAFDLVVSCLTLIDIDDHAAAIAEMARVLAPGGTLLVANLTPQATAGTWRDTPDGPRHCADHYLDARAEWVEWRGIRVRNWHRPLSAYMSAFLAAGLVLTHFDEPEPDAAENPARAARYRRMPWFLVTEWRRPD